MVRCLINSKKIISKNRYVQRKLHFYRIRKRFCFSSQIIKSRDFFATIKKDLVHGSPLNTI